MTEVLLTLPVPPSANKYWLYGGGRVRTSPEAKAYKDAVRLLTKCDMIHGRVAVNVSVFRPAKRGDLDNYLKVMLDALEGVLYENDKQITEIHAFRYDDADNPRVELLAYEDLEEGRAGRELAKADGDWICPKEGFTNQSTDKNCFACGAAPPDKV